MALPEFKTEDNDNVLLVRILLGISVAVALGIGAMVWWQQGDNARRAEEFYAKAQDECHQNKLDACLYQVNKALTLAEKEDYYRLKFSALYSDFKYYEAKMALDKLLAYNPKNAHYHYLMRTMAWNEGKTDLAFSSVDKAIELEPANGDYRVAKATMLYDSDRQPEAVPVYQQLLKEDPNNYHYWDQYALSYSNNDHVAEALIIRLDGVQKYPGNYLHHFGLGSLYDQMGKKPEAVAAYRKSLELHPMENSIAARRIYEITGKRVPASMENLTSISIPYEKRAKVMFVRADINGKKGTFLLDTGASMSCLYRRKVEKYGIQPLHQVLPFETANGFIQAPIAYGNLRLGKYDLETARFAVIPDASDPNIDGIIGMNVLEEFQFAINPNGTITLRR